MGVKRGKVVEAMQRVKEKGQQLLRELLGVRAPRVGVDQELGDLSQGGSRRSDLTAHRR